MATGADTAHSDCAAAECRTDNSRASELGEVAAAADHHLASLTGQHDDVIQASPSPDDDPLERWTRIQLKGLVWLPSRQVPKRHRDCERRCSSFGWCFAIHLLPPSDSMADSRER